MSTRLMLIVAAAGLLTTGCKRDPIGVDTDTTDFDTDLDTDTGFDSDTDSDSDTDPDTGTTASATMGFAFCAAGGRVSSAAYTATLCLGPADVGIGTVQGAGFTWQAGPIYVVDP